MNKFISNKYSNSSLQKVAHVIRGLAIDSIQSAGTGHVGTVLGCAELGAYLFGHFLNITSKNPKWINRDHFVLSAGHASLLLYTGLHLRGYPISSSDLASYREFGSLTPSHPEISTVGIDVSTGLDGQGIGYGVGIALHNRLLAQHLNTHNKNAINSKTVVLAGDGCFMEGVSSEACSFAGHLSLNDLIVIYDSNNTSLDGFISESFSENTAMRFQSYGWDVVDIDGHDLDSIHNVFNQLRKKQTKPCLIIAKTTIGKGASQDVGSYKIHKGTLNQNTVPRIKKKLDLPISEFEIPKDVLQHFSSLNNTAKENYLSWKKMINDDPTIKRKLLDLQKDFPEISAQQLFQVNIENGIKISGREYSHEILNTLAKHFESIIAGSADLASSDFTFIKNSGLINKNDFSGRNIKYGVREFAMGAIAAGMALSGLFIPVIGTFLAFSDYMKSAIRMIAQMQLRVIMHFTHDSFWIGHDGPTHQPIEQIANLRSIPNLQVIRPANTDEIKMGWISALNYAGPTALILPRQTLLCAPQASPLNEKNIYRGAYYIKTSSDAKCRIFATGSEVQLALAVAENLQVKGIGVDVVSFPSWEMFEQQDLAYKSKILDGDCIKVSIEAASSQGWHKYIGRKGISFSIETFGCSGSPTDLAKHFGFNQEAIAQRILDEYTNTILST